MKKVLKIDQTGLFIEDVILQDGKATPDDCIETPCPDGFYLPKWDGAVWVEGMAQAAIDAIKAQATATELSQEERLTTLETVQDEIVDTLATALGVTL